MYGDAFSVPFILSWPHSLSIYHGGVGVGAEDFGEFSLERKGGMVNISEGRKGRMPIFLDVIERLSICNIITKQVKFLIF